MKLRLLQLTVLAIIILGISYRTLLYVLNNGFDEIIFLKLIILPVAVIFFLISYFMVYSINYDGDKIVVNAKGGDCYYYYKDFESISFFCSPFLLGLCVVRLSSRSKSKYIFLSCPIYNFKNREKIKQLEKYLSRDEGIRIKVCKKMGIVRCTDCIV